MAFAFSTCLILVLSHLALAKPIPQDSYGSSSASAYCTNSNGSYQLTSISAPVLNSGSGDSTWSLNIDDTSSGYKQTIDGFGAAVTDATVATFTSLSSSTLDQLLNELLTSNGADFGIMRHTVGASDLSADPAYSYDDSNGQADPSLNNFNIGDRGTSMAQLLAQMKGQRSDMKILGSSWSAPGWMKVNGNFDGDTTDNNLSDQYLDSDQADYSSAFAQYFVDYIQAYANLGATIDAITIQNEPLNSQSGYPTMYVFDYESAKLIQNNVGPALSSAGLSTSVWAYDHNTDVPSYPQNVLDGAGQYVDTVAWHCYASSVDWSTLTNFHNSNPNVNQYMTECWTPVTDSSDWYQSANFTMGPLQNWASGVLAWTLGTDENFGPYLSEGGCHTCQGLVTINSDGSYTYNTAYYQMSQFSKFMPRGAIVLSGSGSSSDPDAPGVQSVASLNPDSTRTVVILNTEGNDQTVSLQTSSGENWSGSVPANSIVTWVLPAAS